MVVNILFVVPTGGWIAERPCRAPEADRLDEKTGGPLLRATPPEEECMSWTTPKVVEISVGMEINSYACADL
ncbi:MAG: pyrroloquinoline quinone precursor peptide PqqA [Bacteroidota bacterium]|nr:pyrroloquinoline quinone precursor peptide PqqA [Kiloniellaceae bacterium]